MSNMTVARGSLYIILSLSWLLTSCVQHQQSEVPDSWAKPISPQQKTCVDVTGIYQNRGEASDNKAQTEFLSEFLVSMIPRSRALKHRWIEQVELRDPQDGQLQALFRNGERILYQKTLK
ncbi:MAG: hypothetical protein Q9N02_06250 [Ghiorsea sp.]|nr:hypothetical protein [Ghiorsea sp.]